MLPRPFTFRHDPAGGGALADIGSHALATAEFLCGPITRVHGRLRDDDQPSGRTARAASGRSRSTTSAAPSCASPAARPAPSRRTGSRPAARCSTTSRSIGTKGALAFSQERFNELHLLQRPADAARPAGFPPHRGGAGPCALRPLLRRARPPARLQRPEGDRGGAAISTPSPASRPEPFRFRAGLRIQALVETIQASSRQQQWKDVS